MACKYDLTQYLQVITTFSTPNNFLDILEGLSSLRTVLDPAQKLFERTIQAMCSTQEMQTKFFEICSTSGSFGELHCSPLSLCQSLLYCGLAKSYLHYLDGKTLSDSEVFFLHNLKTNSPDIFQEDTTAVLQYKAKLNQIRSLIESTRVPCYYPIVTNSDSTDPRVTKFGGRVPYIKPFIPTCGGCEQPFALIFSLYIGTLPDEIKSYFPANDHDCVIICYGCPNNECWYEYNQIIIAKPNELQYANDNPSRVFNEPRTITGWRKDTMTIKSSENMRDLHPELNEWELYLVDECNNAPQQFTGFPTLEQLQQMALVFPNQVPLDRENGTYLGGYPKFVQDVMQPQDEVLLMEMEHSEAAKFDWGDGGTAQVWLNKKFCALHLTAASC